MVQATTEIGSVLEAVKAKQRKAWGTGRYARIGSLLQISGERLVEAMDARPGSRFLDVAAGNGNLTLAAARRYCRVVSTDYVLASLRDAAGRVDANGFDVRFEPADAESLPFPDGSFDVVGSTFGVMFTPDQEKAASEMLRVCAPGGTIGLANWTPDGFIGRLFREVGRFLPPPAGVASPARWGTAEFLEQVFGADARRIEIRRRSYSWRFVSAEHFMRVFREFYGPIIKAFEAVEADRRVELEAALMKLLVGSNVAKDGTLDVPSEYLEVVITKKG